MNFYKFFMYFDGILIGIISVIGYVHLSMTLIPKAYYFTLFFGVLLGLIITYQYLYSYMKIDELEYLRLPKLEKVKSNWEED